MMTDRKKILSQPEKYPDMVQPLVTEIHQAALAYQKKGEVAPLFFQGYQDFLKTGHRQQFEKQYFTRRKELAVLIFDNYFSPTNKGLALLENVLWEVCNEYSWGVPAHIPTKDQKFTPESRFFIDLFASETAQALAEGKWLLADKLSPMIQQRIDEELTQRIFEPFQKKTWHWETMANNWSAVVPGSVGMAALLSCHQEKKLKPILKKVETCLTNYLASFDDDGACREGIGYWSYGFGYYIYYAELYRQIRQDDYFFQLKKVKSIASFPFKTQLFKDSYVPFSDYTGTSVPVGLLTFCEEEFGFAKTRKQINGLDFDHAYRFAHLFRNLFWSKQTSAEEKIEKESFYLPQAQWLIKKNAPLFFAAKGGKNDESHNHNDVGNFILGADRHFFLTDLGAGEYTTPYFAEKTRYDFLTTSSKGHSLPVINGKFQQSGPRQAKEVQQNADLFSLALEEVYPKDAHLKKFQRTFQTSEDLKTLHLTDYFHFTTEKNQVVESFVTILKPQLVGKTVTLSAGNWQCQLQFETDQIQLKEVRYLDHTGLFKLAYLIQGQYALSQKETLKIKIELNPVSFEK